MKPVIAAAFTAATLACTDAAAQAYPNKTIRVVVPYAAGGNTDFTARVIATKLTDVFGQQVVVENRPGGGTIDEFGAFIRDEIDKYAKVVKAANLRVE